MRFTVDADLRARLRRRRQHARVRRRRHPAPPRQDLPGDLPPPVRRRCRPGAGGSRPPTASSTRSVAAVNVAIDGFVAAAREPPRRRPGAARRAAEPARGDDRRRRRSAARGSRRARSPATCMTMLLAGEDTTANTLAWTIWLLHRHPGALRARARRGRRASPATPTQWTPERFAGLDYLEACANETHAAEAGRAVPHAAGAARTHRRRHPRARRTRSSGARCAADSLREEHFDDADRVQARALARRRRRAERDVGEPRRDAVRRRAARLPGPPPGAARDQDGAGDAARPLRDRERRHRATAASPTSSMSFTMSPEPADACGCASALRLRSVARASAASACSQSAIRSSTASRPIEKRTSRPAPARPRAHRRQVVRARPG